MIYYLYNPSTDTDKALNDLGYIIEAGENVVVDSNDISGWMFESSDLQAAINLGAGDSTAGAGDQGLTLHSALPLNNTTVYTTAEALRRLSLSKEASLVQFDNTTAALPNSPTTVQAALEELDSRIDDLGGAQQWKEHVIARVLAISATAPVGPSTGDFYIDTDDDTLYRYDGATWQSIRVANDGDRVIKLDDTAGTFDQEIFAFDSGGGTWSSVGANEDNDAVIVDNDGDGKGALYHYDTSAGSNGDWTKIADIDWGSPTLQSVYDAGSNSVTMTAGDGDVDWNLYDGGAWQVSNPANALNFTISRTTTSLTATGNLSAFNIDTTSGISLDADAASNFTVDGGTLTLSTTTSGNIVVNSVGTVDIDSDSGVSIDDDSGASIAISAAGAITGTTATDEDLTLTASGTGVATLAGGTVTIDSTGLLTMETGADVSWTDGTNVWTPEQTGLRLANYATGGLPALPGVTGNYGAIAFDTTLDRPVVWVTDVDGGGTDGWIDILTSLDSITVTLNEAYEGGAGTIAVPVDQTITMDSGDVTWKLVTAGTNTQENFTISDRDDNVVFNIRETDTGGGSKQQTSAAIATTYDSTTGTGIGVDISDENTAAGGTGGGISLTTSASAGTSGGIVINSGAGVDIDADAASSFTVTAADLTLETATSGNITVSSVGNLTFEVGSSGTLTWSDGTNAWEPEHVGLRLANYATGSLPAVPGNTAYYGAVAFDTSLDRPVVWVSDSDGGGTDGWIDLRTSLDDVTPTMDETYNNFGAAAALVTIDAAESQTTGLEFRLAANTDTFFVSDGTSPITTFVRDTTANAASRLDIGDTAVLGLPNVATSAAPSANVAAGDVFYASDNGLTYFYDGTRSKWLSVQRLALVFSADKSDGNYLYPGGTSNANTSGYQIPADATILSVSVLGASGNATKGMQLTINNNTASPALSFSLSGLSYTNTTANIDVSADDYIGIKSVSTGGRVNDIVAFIEIAYRT